MKLIHPVEPDPVDTLISIAPLLTRRRRDLARAIHYLRGLASHPAAPEYFRRVIRKNTVSLRHALSVRHRALWLSRMDRQAEALLLIDVAKSVLCCESSPCPIGPVDAWLPLHTRVLELLDDTRSGIFHEWRGVPVVSRRAC